LSKNWQNTAKPQRRRKVAKEEGLNPFYLLRLCGILRGIFQKNIIAITSKTFIIIYYYE
jgi:hypothetical protein